MFGYVNAFKSELRLREYEAYRSVYCGLCKELDRRLGKFSRLFLSYDMTFMALLGIFAEDKEPISVMGRCKLNPFTKKCVVTENESLELTAYTAALFVWNKLKDDVADKTFLGGLKARAALIFYRRGYKKAAAALPELAELFVEKTSKLREAERRRESTIDEYCDYFAKMTAAAFAQFGRGEKRRILESTGYFVGKWIYLADALDDIEEDAKAGEFNAFAAVYPPLEGESSHDYRERIKPLAESFLGDAYAMICSSLSLLELKRGKGIIDNIVLLGMPDKAQQIINNQKTDRRTR